MNNLQSRVDFSVVENDKISTSQTRDEVNNVIIKISPSKDPEASFMP